MRWKASVPFDRMEGGHKMSDGTHGKITRRRFTESVGIASVAAALPRLAAAQSIRSTADRKNALDHIVVIMFENRSFDNVLGRLYGPGEVESFEGVIGKNLTNPIPEWAENGASRKFVDYGVATNMNTPKPDPGEEYPHINTDLFGVVGSQEPIRTLVEDGRPLQRSESGAATNYGRIHQRLHQRVYRRDGAPADLRRVRADYDGLLAYATAGDVLARARIRHLRPLVLRSTLADVHQPLVLPRSYRVRLRDKLSTRRCLSRPQHRRDDLRAARSKGSHLARLLRRAEPRVNDRHHSRFSAARPFCYELFHGRRFPGRCEERSPPQLCVHRAEYVARP